MLTVPPAPEVSISYTSVPDGLDPSTLFGVARRINPRRSTLFVSRVLGKHVPVDPAVCLFVGLHLASKVHADTGAGGDPAPALSLADGLASPGAAREMVDHILRQRDPAGPPMHVIGCAETATALGHSVRDGLPRADYVHTTRRVEPGWAPVVTFSEEHSHAVHHRIVHRDPQYLRDDQPILFVDDELTTGRTLLNAIASIQALAPRPLYRVASLLDWRNAAALDAFSRAEARLGTTITVTSLVAGEARWAEDQLPHPDEAVPAGPSPADLRVLRHRVSFGSAVARHGWDAGDQEAFESQAVTVAAQLTAIRSGQRALVLGTEEFMYAPLRAALAMGDGVAYQSTTRSPIIAADVDGYPIRHKAAFANPAAGDRTSFVYNVAPGAYDDIFVLFDQEHGDAETAPLVTALTAARPSALHLVAAGP